MSFITTYLIYYPISAILWFWQKIFSFLGGLLPWVESPESSGIIWALAVIFLVVTLRIFLYWPAAKQIRFSRKMQEIQPQMKALQKRYKNDRVKLAEETRKLQKEKGFNPLLGCLPMLIQIPVFLGLFHVLRSFNRMGEAFGQLGMTAEETRSVGNYVFSADDVQNFLDARLFGTPLSAFIAQSSEQFQAFVEPGAALDFARWNIWLVAIPLMIVSSLATHFNARLTISRQTAEAAANPQARIMNQLMLWAFPIGILVTGAFWPLAILLYMVINNLWTFGQQHFLYGQIDIEEKEALEERQAARAALAPKVGVKPVNPKKAGRSGAVASSAAASSGATETESSADDGPQGYPVESAGAATDESHKRPGFFEAFAASVRRRPPGSEEAEPVSEEDADTRVAESTGGATAPKPGQRPQQGKGKKKNSGKKKKR